MLKARRIRALAAFILMVGLTWVPGDAARSDSLDGPAWNPVRTIGTDNPAYLNLFPDGHGFALQYRGDLPDVGTMQSTFLSTADFGKTWKLETPPVGSYAADFASPTTGYVFTTDQAGRDIFRTTDGGKTWSVLPDRPVDQKLADDAGAYFDMLAAPSPDVLLLGGVVSRYYADCIWQENVAVYRSGDGGKTFSWVEFPYDGVVHQLVMLNARDGVMLASEWDRTNDPQTCSSSGTYVRMHAFVTHDGGRRWTPFATEPYKGGPPPTALGVVSIGIAGPKRLLLGLSNGDILTSQDGGTSFVRARGTRNSQYSGAPDVYSLRCVRSIEFATRNVGYFTTGHGGVWRTTDGGLTWRQEQSTQASNGYSFSSDVAVGNRFRAILAGNTVLSTRVP